MRPARTRRNPAWPATLALLLGSCGGAVEESQAEPFVAADEAGSWAFSYRDRPTSGGGKPRFDLRSLNERVAGEAGFVRLAPGGDNFVLGDGSPARFWAVNSDVFRQTPEAIDKNVRFLARLGVNMVRLHAQITSKDPNSKATDVDEKEIDGIWRYVAAAKGQGIYTTISPYWANSVAAGKWGIEGYGAGNLYGLLFFDAGLQAAYKAWTKALLTRPNPYTGVPLAREPAVAIIQIQNEDSLLFWTSDQIKANEKLKLARQFTAWAVAKHGSIEGALRAWDGFKAPGDDAAIGRLGLIDLWHLTQRQAGGNGRRVGDQLAFYAERQRRFYDEMTAYFKEELGCRQLVNASNWRTADDVTLGDVERWTNAGADVIAANRYYDGGVHLGPNRGWRIDPGDKFSQKAAVSDPRALPFNLKQVAGRPTIVTESGWVAPIAFAAEGPFLAAVYPALTGVDAFYWFNDSTPEFDLNPFFPYEKVQGQEPLIKFTAMTPTIAGGFPAAAVLFRGGFVKQGEPVVHEERSLASLWSREDPLVAEGPTFDPNRDPGVTPEGKGTASRPPGSKGVDPLAFLAGPVEVRLDGTPGQSRVAPQLSKLIDRNKKVVRSVTGEVTMDYGRGVCLLDAPKAQGACGFLGKAGALQFRDVGLNSANAFAAVLVVALDDQPLAASRRALVQVTTAARPTDWDAAPADFAEGPGQPKLRGYEIQRTGKPPWRVADTQLGLAIKNPNFSKATLLDTAGYPAEDVPVAKTKAGITLTLPPDALYVILE